MLLCRNKDVIESDGWFHFGDLGYIDEVCIEVMCHLIDYNYTCVRMDCFTLLEELKVIYIYVYNLCYYYFLSLCYKYKKN